MEFRIPPCAQMKVFIFIEKTSSLNNFVSTACQQIEKSLPLKTTTTKTNLNNMCLRLPSINPNSTLFLCQQVSMTKVPETGVSSVVSKGLSPFPTESAPPPPPPVSTAPGGLPGMSTGPKSGGRGGPLPGLGLTMFTASSRFSIWCSLCPDVA